MSAEGASVLSVNVAGRWLACACCKGENALYISRPAVRGLLRVHARQRQLSAPQKLPNQFRCLLREQEGGGGGGRGGPGRGAAASGGSPRPAPPQNGTASSFSLGVTYFETCNWLLPIYTKFPPQLPSPPLLRSRSSTSGLKKSVPVNFVKQLIPS
jgi:hypothetical protein